MAVFDFNRGSKQNDGKEQTGKRLEEISTERIRPNPNQPRTTFDEESIAELAQSIKEVGLIQPLVVRRSGDHYELVAGERRLRAAKSIGMLRVTCIVQEELQDESSATMALIENLQREDLHYLEEAQCYQTLLDTYHMTQEELAQKLGKSQSSIANKLRVLKLSPEIKEAMLDAGLTERHARALLKLKDEKQQMQMIDKITEKGLSVKETEVMVEKTLDKLYDTKADGAKPRPVIIRMIKDYRLFMNTINMAVNQLRQSDMVVEVEQQDQPDGVDIHITVKRKTKE